MILKLFYISAPVKLTRLYPESGKHYKTICILMILLPNRSFLLRLLIVVQRVVTGHTHTNREIVSRVRETV